jgi:hypothetical protein
MTNVLIEQLYTPNECSIIRELFIEEHSKRDLIAKAISSKLITSKDIITSNPLDELYMICLSAKFADTEDECHRVAMLVYQFHKKTSRLLPSLIEDTGIIFANKTLLCLSFFSQALEKLEHRHGAPSPSFYRKISKVMFMKHEQPDIASHHEQWENFLAEVFI